MSIDLKSTKYLKLHSPQYDKEFAENVALLSSVTVCKHLKRAQSVSLHTESVMEPQTGRQYYKCGCKKAF